MKMNPINDNIYYLNEKDLVDLINYRTYQGIGTYTYNIPYINEELNDLVKKATIEYSSFGISNKCEKIVFGLKKDLIIFDKINNYQQEYFCDIHNPYDNFYNYMDIEYFQKSDLYKVYDVEKDLLINFLHIFELVCYDNENNFIWGKFKNEKEYYIVYTNTKSMILLTNERRIKITNFLNSELY